MLSQLPGKPLQYYDNTMDGFPPTSKNYDFIAHVLNAEDIKVSFDKIDGQDVISNNGHNFNKFTIYKLSDGVNSVLTRVEIKNETTVTLLSDISKIDIRSASLTIPKLGSPLNYEGVDDGGHKCSFSRFPNAGITQKLGGGSIYVNNEINKLTYSYWTGNTSWFVLINESFCCLLQRVGNGLGMAGILIDSLDGHSICATFDQNGFRDYFSVNDMGFHTINRYSISDARLGVDVLNDRKRAAIFPVVFDEYGSDFISNYILSAVSSPQIQGTHDFIYSNHAEKFFCFYLYNSKSKVLMINIDGK